MKRHRRGSASPPTVISVPQAEHDPPSGTTSAAADGAGVQPTDVVPFREAVKAWFLISLQTFGGPAGQIAVMQNALVERKRWIGQRRFLHALNYCMLLPGPEAQQLAIYIGWLLNGVRGGIVAGTLFVLPGVVALMALSIVYVAYGDTTPVTALFAGLAPAVLAIVSQALVRVGRRTVNNIWLVMLALTSFLAIAVFSIPFPVVLVGGAIAGWFLSRRMKPGRAAKDDNIDDGPPPLIPDSALHVAPASRWRGLRILTVGLLLWAAPIVAVVIIFSPDSVFTAQGLFFSGTALVTFGGAYAVLAFVAQHAVHSYGWLAPGEMVRGLALAETTPGPLIMVVQFVAFLGAFRDPGALNPWLAGVIGALLTTWVTFVPCFLFILLGAPYVERLRGNDSLQAAMTGITAIVVGVIANLAVYFTLNTLFGEFATVRWGPATVTLPVLSSIHYVSAGIAVIALVLTFVLRWSVLRTLGVCAALGLIAGLSGLPVS